MDRRSFVKTIGGVFGSMCFGGLALRKIPSKSVPLPEFKYNTQYENKPYNCPPIRSRHYVTVMCDDIIAVEKQDPIRWFIG